MNHDNTYNHAAAHGAHDGGRGEGGPRALELLAPAKDLECGKAAIDHGADAVYIGAERFGARQAAGNPVADIAELCRYAHTYGARVYVTVNTIIYDNELDDTVRTVNSLYEAGADAILVQDMALLKAPLPPIELHASTQTDNRTPEKAAWLAAHGFSRVVLARELSLGEIAAVHARVPAVELEAFVHGALCVSFSGQCYASQHCFGRSANRGECAQFCRLKFSLEDAAGNVLAADRHLLSLKDMCRIDHLEQMAEAGVTSFKIEGRLKDAAYVKNVTAAYSLRLDEMIRRHPDRYRRASWGRCTYTFKPNVDKTFNRGFTDYFLTADNGPHATAPDGGHARPGHGLWPKDDITSFDTPKARGEHVGKVKDIKGAALTVAGTAAFANGDGLCFVNARHELEGFRVNRAEGNKIYPLKMSAALTRGTTLYRNYDKAFSDTLAGQSAVRKIGVGMTLAEAPGGFRLTMTAQTADGPVSAEAYAPAERQTAQKPQGDNIARQLGKLGNTPFDCLKVSLEPEDMNLFVPSSVLSAMRRDAAASLEEALQAAALKRRGGRADYGDPATARAMATAVAEESRQLNIANGLARRLYEDDGICGQPPAYEITESAGTPLMRCRHCLRRSLGRCLRRERQEGAWRGPLYLRLADGRRFSLRFNCDKCEMEIYADH